MYDIQVVEEKSVVATFKVTGLPILTHPQIGDDMSNGVIVNESNQKEYSSLFYREDDECSIMNIDEFEFLSASVDICGNMEISIARDFIDKSDYEIDDYLRKISNLTIFDNVAQEIYNANVIEVGGYVIGE